MGTARGTFLCIAGEGGTEQGRGVPPLGSGREASHRDRLGQDGMQLDGMGQRTKVVGREGTVPIPHWDFREKASLTQASSSPLLLVTAWTR